MTDKEQIIIDGVNVSECNFLGVEGICNSDSYFCEGHTNCYFKQLARKTQEYEQLEEKYEGLKLENEEGYEIVAELENKCEELKERNALLESQMAFNLSEMEIKLGNEINRSETLLKELKRFDKIKDDFREMSEKLKTENTCYRKALEEIEGYAKENDEMLQGYHHEWANNKQILEIINKAKGEKDER